MNAVKFKTLIEQLKYSAERGDEWMDKVPHEVSAAFFDNPYVDSLQFRVDLLIKTMFDEPLLMEVSWFLYEWEESKDESLRTISYPDGRKFVINNVTDFCDYLIAEGYLT